MGNVHDFSGREGWDATSTSESSGGARGVSGGAEQPGVRRVGGHTAWWEGAVGVTCRCPPTKPGSHPNWNDSPAGHASSALLLLICVSKLDKNWTLITGEHSPGSVAHVNV